MSTMLYEDEVLRHARRARRIVRHRLRIEADLFATGRFSDGWLTVVISNHRPAADGRPDSFDWRASRPVGLVIIRAGSEGGDVAYFSGPATAGTATGPATSDPAGMLYVAFCYDAEGAPLEPVA